MGFDVESFVPVLEFGPFNTFSPKPGTQRHPAGRRVVDPVPQFQPENPQVPHRPTG